MNKQTNAPRNNQMNKQTSYKHKHNNNNNNNNNFIYLYSTISLIAQ